MLMEKLNGRDTFNFIARLAKHSPVAVIQNCMVTHTPPTHYIMVFCNYCRRKAPGGGGPLPSNGAPNAIPSGPGKPVIPGGINPGGGAL
jgi:hypothetical protein